MIWLGTRGGVLLHSEKFPGGGGGGWHCNYSFKLQAQISWRFEIDLDIETFRLHMELTWTQPGPDLDRPGPELDKSWQNGKGLSRKWEGKAKEIVGR